MGTAVEDMNKIVEWQSKKIFTGYAGWLLGRVFTSVGSLPTSRQNFYRSDAVHQNGTGTEKRWDFLPKSYRKTLRRYLWKEAVAYQDDVSVATDKEPEHVAALRNIFDTLKKKNLELN